MNQTRREKSDLLGRLELAHQGGVCTVQAGPGRKSGQPRAPTTTHKSCPLSASGHPASRYPGSRAEGARCHLSRVAVSTGLSCGRLSRTCLRAAFQPPHPPVRLLCSLHDLPFRLLPGSPDKASCPWLLSPLLLLEKACPGPVLSLGGARVGESEERRQSKAPGSLPPGPCRSGGREATWLSVLSKQALEQRKAPGRSPVVSLFAELLLKVAQGQALGLQHPPVGDLLPTEEVSDHQLAGLERMHPCQLLGLLVAENEMEKPQVQHLKAVRAHVHTQKVCKRVSSEVRLQLNVLRALGRGPALGEPPCWTHGPPPVIGAGHTDVCAAQ